MPPRSERPFEEKSRCWFEKCILPVSLFTGSAITECAPNRGTKKTLTLTLRSRPYDETTSGTSFGEIFTRKNAVHAPDSPATSSECTEVVSILTIDRLAFITNRTDTSVDRSSASVGAQFHRFSISARQHWVSEG